MCVSLAVLTACFEHEYVELYRRLSTRNKFVIKKELYIERYTDQWRLQNNNNIQCTHYTCSPTYNVGFQINTHMPETESQPVDT